MQGHPFVLVLTVDAFCFFAKGIRGTRSSAEWARAFTAGTSVKSNASYARLPFRSCVDCGCSCAFCKGYPRHKIPSRSTTALALSSSLAILAPGTSFLSAGLKGGRRHLLAHPLPRCHSMCSGSCLHADIFTNIGAARACGCHRSVLWRRHQCLQTKRW